MAIAAGRIGLDCITIGHVGDDIYGGFLLDVLHDEGISMVGMMTPTQQHSDHVASSYQTLLCWVLVDPLQRHGFCRYTPPPPSQQLLLVFLIYVSCSISKINQPCFCFSVELISVTSLLSVG